MSSTAKDQMPSNLGIRNQIVDDAYKDLSSEVDTAAHGSRGEVTEAPKLAEVISFDDPKPRESILKMLPQETWAKCLFGPIIDIDHHEGINSAEAPRAESIKEPEIVRSIAPVAQMRSLGTDIAADAMTSKRKSENADEVAPSAAKKPCSSATSVKAPQIASTIEIDGKSQSKAASLATSCYLDHCKQLPASGVPVRAHLVDVEKYTENKGGLDLKMADIIATVLYMHNPKALEAFMDVSRLVNFTFTRKEKEGSEDLDFSVERSNSIVHVRCARSA